ncbi:MAG: TetR family transcriptional regulator [Desulfobacteraceae bacterium 4572_19]|nr:MAG: TetR family transcriptional regulator [Desulfobacteraceae bacterium 4572_19]
MVAISRKERERRQRRAEILDVAMGIFAKNGFHGTTMANISQESQYPLGTIYKFFSGKKQIYYDLVVEKAFEIRVILIDIFNKTQWPPLERLRKCLTAYARFYRGNTEFIKIYISERSNIDAVVVPNLNEKINRLHEKMIDQFSEIFTEGIISKQFKPLPVREMAILFSDMIHSAAWNCLMKELSDEKMESLLDTVFEIFSGGVIKNSLIVHK